MSSKVAIIVLTHSDSPEGRGRFLHAMYAAKELKDAKQDVRMIFEGAGVTWLTAFHKCEDEYSKTFSGLFDEIRDTIMGASNYVATKRFNAAEAAEAMNIPLLGEDGGHFSVGNLVQEGYQFITF